MDPFIPLHGPGRPEMLGRQLHAGGKMLILHGLALVALLGWLTPSAYG